MSSNDDITRRDFVTITVAGGIAVAAGTNAGAQLNVAERTVEIKTPDGT